MAEMRWKAWRVPASAPDQTDTDRSMMFIAQKPATASARTRRASSGSFASCSDANRWAS